MKLELGIKSDPIETRYSFEWLFDLLAEEGVKNVQIGSFFEMYSLSDDYFLDVRAAAESRGLRLKSMFTAHRELGGFFVGDVRMENVARRMYEQLIHVASVLGVDYVGSNPGAIYRDRPETKEPGIECYLRHMRELSHLAQAKGIKALTIEPMSCMAEPPTTPEEMDRMTGALNAYHRANPGNTVPVWLCGDISHGLADPDKKVIHSNMELFIHAIPTMAEFHFKNTDAIFSSTFGFSPEECARGIVNLKEVKAAIDQNASRWPVDPVVGYLEISGPKTGRDYSDNHLGDALRTSLRAIKEVFA